MESKEKIDVAKFTHRREIQKKLVYEIIEGDYRTPKITKNMWPKF